MRVLIDACVLYPTVLRQIVLGVAGTGAFTPLWSARILEEWRRAAERAGPGYGAEAEIAALRARWPEAEVPVDAELEARISLPDPADAHVLAAAAGAGADELLTLNIKDFPLRVLAEYGVVRRHPDEFMHEAWAADPEGVGAVVEKVYADLRGAGMEMTRRAMLKKARLPRLGKALDQG